MASCFQHQLAAGRLQTKTHPLLLMPVHLQRRPAVPARPPGHEGVLVVPEHYLLLLCRGGGGLGGNIVRPCGVQPMDGVGQQLAVAHSDQLPGLRAHIPHAELRLGLQGLSSLRARGRPCPSPQCDCLRATALRTPNLWPRS